ncbi:uncharacterized protein [Anoplolepis gracilipes]|uniref:uncharacterized protein n=1 Tax=Anoplolepis gracilipes TaxID=354296 RepID=UPI003BA16565
MNILLELPTFLSNEKLQIIRVLNQPLKIPRRLLHIIIPNPTILHKDFSIGKSDFVTRDWLLLQRNIDREIITRPKGWKSTQSSCAEDGVSKKSRGCIEDHRQSAEFCAEMKHEKCENNNCQQISAESCRKSCTDLLNHKEYYQSIESSSPIYSDKPVPYNDRRACDSVKHDCYKLSIISCEKWTRGKSAMERKVYHKCKPKLCAYTNIRDEAIHFPSDVPRDCNEGKLKEITIDKLKRVETTHSARQSSKTEPSVSEKISSEKKDSPVKSKISKPSMSQPSMSDINEQLKPDPPPPKYPHWSEKLLSYYDQCSEKKVRTSTVPSSPMIFVPRKEPWKPWTKGTTSSVQDDCGKSTSKNECHKTKNAKTRIIKRDTPCLPKSVSEKHIPRRVISFENKCAASLTFPAHVNKTKRRVQRFPTLTKSGSCQIEKPEKDFSTPDVSDCSPNIASFKYRLSKCPSIKMWSIGVNQKSSATTDVHARPKQESALSVCEKIKRQESRAQNKEEGKKRKFKSSGKWIRQRYKTRLKIFQKGNGRLDPCLPRIVELRQPRDGKMRSILSKLFGLAADEGELSPRLKSPCRPPDNCPSKWPVVENKSYPTKMNESRVVRDQNVGKRLCKKR